MIPYVENKISTPGLWIPFSSREKVPGLRATSLWSSSPVDKAEGSLSLGAHLHIHVAAGVCAFQHYWIMLGTENFLFSWAEDFPLVS